MKAILFTISMLTFCGVCSCRQTAKEYHDRGIAKASLGDYGGAIVEFSKAIEIDPHSAEIFYRRGLAKSKLEDYRGAIADFSKAIEIDPRNAGAYNTRGLAKYWLGDKDEGCLDISKARELGFNAYDAVYLFCN